MKVKYKGNSARDLEKIKGELAFFSSPEYDSMMKTSKEMTNDSIGEYVNGSPRSAQGCQLKSIGVENPDGPGEGAGAGSIVGGAVDRFSSDVCGFAESNADCPFIVVIPSKNVGGRDIIAAVRSADSEKGCTFSSEPRLRIDRSKSRVRFIGPYAQALGSDDEALIRLAATACRDLIECRSVDAAAVKAEVMGQDLAAIAGGSRNRKKIKKHSDGFYRKAGFGYYQFDRALLSREDETGRMILLGGNLTPKGLGYSIDDAFMLGYSRDSMYAGAIAASGVKKAMSKGILVFWNGAHRIPAPEPLPYHDTLLADGAALFWDGILLYSATCRINDSSDVNGRYDPSDLTGGFGLAEQGTAAFEGFLGKEALKRDDVKAVVSALRAEEDILGGIVLKELGTHDAVVGDVACDYYNAANGKCSGVGGKTKEFTTSLVPIMGKSQKSAPPFAIPFSTMAIGGIDGLRSLAAKAGMVEIPLANGAIDWYSKTTQRVAGFIHTKDQRDRLGCDAHIRLVMDDGQRSNDVYTVMLRESPKSGNAAVECRLGRFFLSDYGSNKAEVLALDASGVMPKAQYDALVVDKLV